VCSAAVRPAVADVAVAVGVPTFAVDHTVVQVFAIGYPAVQSTLLLPVFVLLLAYLLMLVYMLMLAFLLFLASLLLPLTYFLLLAYQLWLLRKSFCL